MLATLATAYLAWFAPPLRTCTPLRGRRLRGAASVVACEAPPPPVDELRALYEDRSVRSAPAEDSWATTASRSILERSFSLGWQPRLQPHDIPVLELDGGELTPEALEQLFSHEAAAVVVRGFVDTETCALVKTTLCGEADADEWRNWRLNGDASSDVDKMGRVSSEALGDFDVFREYLHTRPGRGGLGAALDARLRAVLGEGREHPFDRLHAALDAAHAHGCRRAKLGRFELPAGAFRRMRHSTGLIHADTSPRLSAAGGEYAANIYLSTARAQGSLHVYPALQYGAAGHAAVAPLEWKLRNVHEEASQALLAGALPLRRTVELNDGDLVLLCTGRFHAVERFEDGDRLSGQCWLSFQRGKALRMWV